MTVQDLIDELEKVTDKFLPVKRVNTAEGKDEFGQFVDIEYENIVSVRPGVGFRGDFILLD